MLCTISTTSFANSSPADTIPSTAQSPSSTPSTAQSPTNTPQTAQSTTNAPPTAQSTTNEEEINITVGYLENYGILNSPSIRGAEGFGYEYLEEVEKFTNYKFTYVSTSWVDGFKKLQKGEIDLFGPASMSEDRKKAVEFVPTPICYESACIFAPIDSNLYYNDTASLNGLTIGLTQGAVYREVLEKFIADNNIDLKIKFVEDTNFMSHIEKGEIDIFLAGSLMQLEGTKIIGELYTEPLYFISAKGNTQLCNNIDAALADIEKSNPYFNELLWYKYYGANQKANKYISQEEKQALMQKDVYKVGFHADLHPISYTDTNNQPKGYAIDIMNILADKLGIAITYIPLHDKDNNSPEDLDFNLCPINDSCQTHGHYSKPYDIQSLLIVRDHGLAKDEVQNIIVPDFATINIEDFLFLYTSATLHKSTSSTDSTNIINSVKPDCKIIPEGSEMLITNKKDKNISVLDASLPIGVMVSEQLPIEVLTATNKAITSLNKGVVDELVIENVMAVMPELTLLDTIVKYQYLIAAIVFFVAGLIGFVLWKSNQRTKRILEVDTLTGVSTKYKFITDVTRILANARPDEYMLLLLDVDNLKAVNNSGGIEKGNKLLCAIAKSLKVHQKDGILIGRIQNDVFAILAKNQILSALPYDEDLEIAIKSLGLNFQIYFSVGACVINNPQESIISILDNAKIAKDIGKSVHGNTFYTYTSELKNKQDKKQLVLASMEKALAEKEFFILIQPKVELNTLKLTGGEALVRWKTEDGSFIYPDEFIPLFERNHFIKKLDLYVFEQTCSFIKNSRVKLPKLSVNISAISLMEQNAVENYMEVLSNYGLKPQQLELELTESAINNDFYSIKKLISRFKSCGFSIAIDDFGKGESSLTRIKELDIDTIKLDKGFIDKKLETQKDIVVLENLIKMIVDLGFSVISEGIETENHRKLILQAGCKYGQGYLFDRPLSQEDFLSRVKNNAKEEFPKIEQNLQRDKKALRDIEMLPYGIAVFTNDAQFTVIEANENFYTIIGCNKKEFLLMYGNSFKDIVVENITDGLSAHASHAGANGSSIFSTDIHIASSKALLRLYVSYKEDKNIYIATIMMQ